MTTLFLYLDIISASFLSGSEYGETTKKDPYMKVKFGQLSAKTPVHQDTLEPRWRHRVVWPLDDFLLEQAARGASMFEIKVANKNTFRSPFMGGYVAGVQEMADWLDEVIPEDLPDDPAAAFDRVREMDATDIGEEGEYVAMRTFKLYTKKRFKALAKGWTPGSDAGSDSDSDSGNRSAVVGVAVLALSLGTIPSARQTVHDEILGRLNAILGPASDVEAKYDSHGRVIYVDHARHSVSYETPLAIQQAEAAEAETETEIETETGTEMGSGMGPGIPMISETLTESDWDDEGFGSAVEELGYPGAPEWWASKVLGPLPPAWEVHVDDRTGRNVYVNHGARKTSWDDPRVPGDVTALDADLQTVIALNGELPEGWERRITSSGRLYYINAEEETSSWTPPGAEFSELETYRDGLRGAFPPGWERKILEDGSIFYVNHLSRSTTWEDPRLSASEDGGSGLAGPSSLNTAAGSSDSRDFQTKLETFRERLPTLDGETLIRIHRDRMFEDSYQRIMALDTDALKRYFRVEFIGEAGLDYGGLSREYFATLSQSMFSPFYGLFEYCGADQGTLQINSNSGLVVGESEHLDLFRFIGRTMGLAIRNAKLMEAFFTPAFYKHILRRPATLRDMQSYDLETYNSLEWASHNSIENILFETFCVIDNSLGTEHVVDLIDGGRDIDVTDANKARYVGLLMNYYLFDSVEPQMDALRSGINDVFDIALLNIFDSRQLEFLISGLGEINVDDWEANTEYSGYTASSKQVRWFWAIIREFSNEERSRVLSFATGTSRVPLGGFAHLIGSNGVKRFELSARDQSERLPVSHACFNRIDLPKYRTRQLLETKLRVAISETAGFGLQ